MEKLLRARNMAWITEVCSSEINSSQFISLFGQNEKLWLPSAISLMTGGSIWLKSEHKACFWVLVRELLAAYVNATEIKLWKVQERVLQDRSVRK